jgi:DNA-binding MarR family transcriptional regulator
VAGDEDFVGCLAGNLRAAARVATRLYDARLAGVGLRIGQVALLAQVRRHGPLSASRLADLLAIERSAVVRDLQVLERLGLVRSAPDPRDRRGRHLSLTPEGARRLEAAAPRWRAAQELMRDRLGGRSMAELVELAQLVVARGEEGVR